MSLPLVVSYHTPSHRSYAKKFINSCRRFHIEHTIEVKEDFGGWELNCAYKPFFLYQMLETYQRDLLWVDIDAVFRQPLEALSEFSKEVLAFIHPELPFDHPSKVRSGTLYVKNSAIARKMLRTWADECRRLLLEKRGRFYDQVALREVLFRWPQGEKYIGQLPVRYVKIFDNPYDHLFAPLPIIEHHQASRQLFRAI